MLFNFSGFQRNEAFFGRWICSHVQWNIHGFQSFNLSIAFCLLIRCLSRFESWMHGYQSVTSSEYKCLLRETISPAVFLFYEAYLQISTMSHFPVKYQFYAHYFCYYLLISVCLYSPQINAMSAGENGRWMGGPGGVWGRGRVPVLPYQNGATVPSRNLQIHKMQWHPKHQLLPEGRFLRLRPCWT